MGLMTIVGKDHEYPSPMVHAKSLQHGDGHGSWQRHFRFSEILFWQNLLICLIRLIY